MDKPTLDLDSRVIDFIKSNVKLPVPVEMGRQDRSGPAIVYVMEPTNEVHRYFNGRLKRAYAFTLMAKVERWTDATSLLDQINQLMEDAKPSDIKSSNGSFQYITAVMTASPSYRDAVEDDGVTYSVYAASFKVTIIIN